MSLTEEQKNYLKELRELVAEGKSVNDALAEVAPKLKGSEEIPALKAAVEQLEKQMTRDLNSPGGFLNRGGELAYNGRGYNGMFAHEGEALCMGMFLRATIEDAGTNDEKASREAFHAEYKNLYGKDYSTDPSASGGALQASDFLDRILSYFETFGGVYAAATKLPVGGADASLLKETARGSGDTAGVYLVNEGSAPNTSDDSFEKVNFNPKEWARLVYYPKKLARTTRANVRIGEMVARSIAWSFRRAYDYVAIQGTGSVGHLRVQGIIPKLQGLSATKANIAGIVVGAGNAWSELTDANHLSVMGRYEAEKYAGEPSWWCSRNYFFDVMVRLMMAGGGVTAGEIEGRRRMMFHGDPVELTSIMPRVEANSQIPTFYGSIADTVAIGESLRLTLDSSDQAKWAERQVGVMGLVDTDVVVHNIGNASATASERVPGGVIGLETASS